MVSAAATAAVVVEPTDHPWGQSDPRVRWGKVAYANSVVFTAYSHCYR